MWAMMILALVFEPQGCKKPNESCYKIFRVVFSLEVLNLRVVRLGSILQLIWQAGILRTKLLSLYNKVNRAIVNKSGPPPRI